MFMLNLRKKVIFLYLLLRIIAYVQVLLGSALVLLMPFDKLLMRFKNPRRNEKGYYKNIPSLQLSAIKRGGYYEKNN
jgi:hypothetical protein